MSRGRTGVVMVWVALGRYSKLWCLLENSVNKCKEAFNFGLSLLTQANGDGYGYLGHRDEKNVG